MRCIPGVAHVLVEPLPSLLVLVEDNPQPPGVGMVLRHTPKGAGEDFTGKCVYYNKYGGSIHTFYGQRVHVIEEWRILAVVEA